METVYYVNIRGMRFVSTDHRKLKALLEDVGSREGIWPKFYNEVLHLSKTQDIYVL